MSFAIDEAGRVRARMIVGFLINTCEPFYRGGYERRAWAFARELVRQGHEVRIYTSCPKDEIIEGVRFIRLGPRRNFFNRQGVRNGWADVLFALGVLRLLWKIRASELDVLEVCATPFLHLPVIAGVARVKRLPLVLTCHEALLLELERYVRERGLAGGLMGRGMLMLLTHIYRQGMSLVPRRLAVSQRTAAALEHEGYPARAVVEFGLEREAIRKEVPRESTPPVRFISCGRLTPIKSVEVAVAALISLHGEGEPLRFEIIGEGSERSRLEKMVESSQAHASIRFHGEVSEAAKRELLAGSDVFILSSPREGFSIATLEAMAQGCCALVVNDPQRPNGALDFVRDGVEGFCVAPGVEPMRHALRRLMQDAELRERMRGQAWESARRYQIEAQTLRLVEFYSAAGAG